MPITFGSIGDIISICLIVKDLVDTLKRYRASSDEYKEVIRELWILDRALLEVELLSRTHSTTVELNALCETAGQTVEKCRLTVEAFSQRIKKYDRSFGKASSGSIVKDAAMKIQWQFTQRDEVAKFRAEVAAHSTSINMLLATASVKLMKINNDKLNARLSDAEQKTQTSLSHRDRILDEVRNRLEENNRLVSAGNATTRKLMNSLRLEWFKQLGLELRDFMLKIIRINFATYRAVIAIQAGLPTRLERSLIQEPFILEDAIGRIAPVHLQFIDSWEAFDAVLELRFRDMHGFKKICQKEYILQEHATGREIDRSRHWKTSFLPGQRIDMSLIFKREVVRGQKSATASCPKCHLTSDKPTDMDIECTGCGTSYRRITEIYEVEPPPLEPLPSPWKTKAQFGQNSFGRVVSKPASLEKRKVAEIDAEDDFMDFKRIRLICRRKRVKRLPSVFSPYRFQTSSAWSMPLPSAGSAIELNLNRSSGRRSTQGDVRSSQGTYQQNPSSFQFSPGMLERTSPPAKAGALAKHADTSFGIWTEAHRSVVEVEEEDGGQEGPELASKIDEDSELEDSLRILNLPRGATLSDVRDTYSSFMAQNRLPHLHKDFNFREKWTRIRLAYEILAAFFLKDYDIAFAKNLATREDAHQASALLASSSSSYATLGPREELISFVNHTFYAHSLGEFIDGLVLMHHGPGASSARESGIMWLYLTEISSKMKRLREILLSNTGSEQRDAGLQNFLVRGEKIIFGQLKGLLSLCESFISESAKQGSDKKNSEIDKATCLEIVEALFESQRGCNARRSLVADIHDWILEICSQCEDIFSGPEERSQFGEISKYRLGRKEFTISSYHPAI